MNPEPQDYRTVLADMRRRGQASKWPPLSFTPARSRTSRDAGSPDTIGAASGRAAPEGIL